MSVRSTHDEWRALIASRVATTLAAFAPANEGRCRVVSRSYVGEWWTPLPGEVIKLRADESIEWERA